jgi:hypothetical protein
MILRNDGPAHLAMLELAQALREARSKLGSGMAFHHWCEANGISVAHQRMAFLAGNLPHRTRHGVTKPTPTGTTNLYRAFNGDGTLLYVGVALIPIRRFSQHRDQAPWFDEIANITMERFPSREAASRSTTSWAATHEPGPWLGAAGLSGGAALRAHEETYPKEFSFRGLRTAEVACKVYPLAENRPPRNAETAGVSRALHLLRAKGRVDKQFGQWILLGAGTRAGVEQTLTLTDAAIR